MSHSSTHITSTLKGSQKPRKKEERKEERKEEKKEKKDEQKENEIIKDAPTPPRKISRMIREVKDTIPRISPNLYGSKSPSLKSAKLRKISFITWLETHPKVIIYPPVPISPVSVLSFLTTTKQLQEKDCLFLFSDVAAVKSSLVAQIPDEMFSDYSMTSIVEHALQNETYIFIDSYHRFIKSPLAIASEKSSARFIFILPSTESNSNIIPPNIPILELSFLSSLIKFHPLPSQLDVRGLVTLVLLNSNRKQLIVVPSSWVDQVKTLLTMLNYPTDAVTTKLLVDDLDSYSIFYLLTETELTPHLSKLIYKDIYLLSPTSSSVPHSSSSSTSAVPSSITSNRFQLVYTSLGLTVIE